ncbi:acetylglucosaminyldiphosphoundecaprenol acetyl-beta-D-mannosaminyltransferase [Halolactibacillus alkaliphilus]|uniref:Acetylglucosaminyldiphosphoundecaprenol acetyl-beta-D-mannosaminyltransferase n=1 Tax=Halolactibacillus alkaliphilus TaxID=442899 RepID=A0A511X563_9BACI|nr:WecB/TagA/CpsF family glycosyltransferase [Halolactibacillus alkaliphilus]GEN58055.1 acetylglucosaminyldiphosphoundecaprenol acetyl-beta-D-mannosaminyltransferase [Halolactibacillus alkaliphilus]GGN76298.1 acetylglucosaminyldiphosphoundecaprenol acetyl-beta-D-mannosaminyltransferase [Halolactibacillus alkaliphilus]SFP13433.1 N-acetylglucosaminyldiphosphoundecaprenol N-acetyl-beta-D-mannosaminyltransferase [Halolactibacillus alkaliphilus]
MKEVNILNVNILCVTKEVFLEKIIYPRLKFQQLTHIVTANPEVIVKAYEDEQYFQSINTADFVIADGIGVVKGARILGGNIPERIAGFDLMQDLLEYADKKQLRCYFFGGSNLVIQEMMTKVNKQFNNIVVAGYRNGYDVIDEDVISKELLTKKPDLIFVGLGVPKQDDWIGTYKSKVNKGVFIGVGGSFDVLAGEVKRAPDFWIKLNLEWLYRSLKQPSRLKRLSSNFKFIFMIFYERLKKI